MSLTKYKDPVTGKWLPLAMGVGATFVPSVSEDGVLSWTNDRGLNNPNPVNIKGKDTNVFLKKANVGDTLVVKAVDENGAPTEWEAVEPACGTTFGNTIEWDGGIEGIPMVWCEGHEYYKVSDAVPTIEDFAEGFGLGRNDNYEEYESRYAMQEGNIILVRSGMAIIALEPNADYGGATFPEAGTYFQYEDYAYNDPMASNSFTSVLTIFGRSDLPITKKLAAKYLPASVPMPRNVSAGQVIAVYSTDGRGNPLGWETVDPVTDDHINALIDAKLGVIENGTY